MLRVYKSDNVKKHVDAVPEIWEENRRTVYSCSHSVHTTKDCGIPLIHFYMQVFLDLCNTRVTMQEVKEVEST
jgi:hypothetical protein